MNLNRVPLKLVENSIRSLLYGDESETHKEALKDNKKYDQRKKVNARNKAFREAGESVGMKRVKGNLGGTYWE